ncbi:Zinc finger, CCHC-type [Sesbania bispinosa]|nr:Zinc finger, CCHC-type [Sesbania bispinosa]
MEERSLSAEEADILRRSTKKQKQIPTEAGKETAADPASQGKILFPTSIGMSLERKVTSYRDICFGMDNDHESVHEDTSEDDSSGFNSESEGSDSEEEFLRNLDPLCPIVKISRMEKKYLCTPWKKAVIVKLLGKRIGLKMLQTRLSKLWQTTSSMEIINLENDYFLLRFSNVDDLNYVFENGPWMIMDHYLVVQKWHPEFFPFEDSMQRVAVWVRVPGLPVEYYDSKILRRIGNSLGRRLKIDSNTLRQRANEIEELCTERAKFARLCNEVNLTEALISRFILNGRRYRVEYEGLHLVCFHCGCYGHRRDSCPSIPTETTKEVPEIEVQQLRRLRRAVSAHEGGSGKAAANSTKKSGISEKSAQGSRFDVLNNLGDDVAIDKEAVDKSVHFKSVPPDVSKSGLSKSIPINLKKSVRSSKKSQQKSDTASDASLQPTTNNCKPPAAGDNVQNKSHSKAPIGISDLTGRKSAVLRKSNESEQDSQDRGKFVSLVGVKSKGRVGLNSHSRVTFKGVRDAARKFAAAPQATWSFASLND